MKLPDNLKRIRKENNLSQEQLAEKLGVSRQAVSKWESGQSYPEMDKVLMICKLFNYNIDELMNENVKEVSENKKSKVNLNKYIDDFFAYVTKTIRMFESMKFSQKLKCIIEQIILILCLYCVFFIVGVILASVFGGLFNWVPTKIYTVIGKMFEAIYLVFAIVFGIVFILHIFKIRYLDYYEIVEEKEKVEEKEISDKEAKSSPKVVLEKNKEKIIIRDPIHSESKFLNGILKVIMFGLKAFVGFCALGFVFTLICLCISLICSFMFVKTGFVFVGALLCIIAGICINITILEILYNFIISKENAKLRIGITLLASAVVVGIGIGIALIGATKFNYINEVDEEDLETKTYTFDMEDDLSIDIYEDIEYIASENTDVQIEIVYYKNHIPYITEDKYNSIYISGISYSSDYNTFEKIRMIIDDINKMEIRDYEYLKVYVRTTQENIDKIQDNAYKWYDVMEEYE